MLKTNKGPYATSLGFHDTLAQIRQHKVTAKIVVLSLGFGHDR